MTPTSMPGRAIRAGPAAACDQTNAPRAADLVGLDLTLAIHNYILPPINAESTPSKTLQTKAAK